MHQLIYQSTSAMGVDAAELRRIADFASVKNRRLGISSVLMVHDRTILHILEGQRVAVRDLYDHISADMRHQDCLVVIDRATDQREFGTHGAAFREVDASDVARFRTTISTLKVRQRERIRSEARAMIAEFAQIETLAS